MSFSMLTETGSGGAWPKNVSALRSHPQEMPVRPGGVCTDGKKRCLLLAELDVGRAEKRMEGV